MKIAGRELKAKRVPIGRIFAIMQDALHELDNGLVGMPLHDKAEECLNTGRFPMGALGPLLFESLNGCNPEVVDMDDAQALVMDEYLDDVLNIVAYAIGGNDGIEAAKAAKQKAAEEKKAAAAEAAAPIG
jgi:hypothetical protein